MLCRREAFFTLTLFDRALRGAGARAIAAIISTLVLILVARYLGADQRGVFVFMLSVCAMCAVIATFSVQNAIHEKIAALDRISTLLSMFVVILVVLSVALCIYVTLWTLGLLQMSIYALWGYPLVLIAVGELFFRQLLIFYGLTETLNRILISAALATLVVSGLCIFLDFGIEGVIFGYAFGRLTLCVASAFALRGKSNESFKVSIAKVKTVLARSWLLHPAILGQIAISQTDILMLGILLPGMVDVGYYQIAAYFVSMFYLFAQSTSAIFFGEVKKKSLSESWNQQRNLILTLMPYIFIGCALVFFASPIIVHLVGREFQEVETILRVLIFAVPLVMTRYFMEGQVVGRGYFKLLSGFTLLVALVNVAGNWYLIPSTGALGAAFVSVASQFLYLPLILYFWFVFSKPVPKID
jgi:O-antigen/teichoic acid export membrane protein